MDEDGTKRAWWDQMRLHVIAYISYAHMNNMNFKEKYILMIELTYIDNVFFFVFLLDGGIDSSYV